MATKTKSSTAEESSNNTSRKKTPDRKYSPSASRNVEMEMRAMKQGKLKSGRSGKTVTNPKQAIAIGLSEARREGKKVPAQKTGADARAFDALREM